MYNAFKARLRLLNRQFQARFRLLYVNPGLHLCGTLLYVRYDMQQG